MNKKLLLLLTGFLASAQAIAQQSVLNITYDTTVKKIMLDTNGRSTGFDAITITDGALSTINSSKLAPLSEDPNASFKNLAAAYDSAHAIVLIYEKKPKGDTTKIYYCTEKTKFVLTSSGCNQLSATAAGQQDTDTYPEPAFPYFSNFIDAGNWSDIDKIDLPQKRDWRGRILIVDARPYIRKANNSLYKLTRSNEFKSTRSLPANGSLSVLVRGYNFYEKQTISVTVSGSDYSYTKDIGDMYKSAIATSTGSTAKASGNTSNSASTGGDGSDAKNDPGTDKWSAHFKAIADTLQKHFQAMNINDLDALSIYKAQLDTFIRKNKIKLSQDAMTQYSRIMRYSPMYVGITPFNISVPENDEATITLSLKQGNTATTQTIPLGTYRESRGLSVGIGSMIRMANLKNYSSYIDEVDGKKYARLDSTGKYSIGIGMGADVMYRSGSLVNVGINLGFFVPFSEDISPFFAIGPAVTFGTKNVTLSITGGLAAGKINAISNQYKDKDLTSLTLTNDQITQKSWNLGWQFGIGLRYNLSSGK